MYGEGALGVNLSCSGSRFNETIIGQQNMFSVGALEASFRKVVVYIYIYIYTSIYINQSDLFLVKMVLK